MAINNATNLYTPNRIIVDANGTTPFTTVASGIAAAVALGGIVDVFIRPGTYNENLVLVSNINLIGSNPDSVIINGVHTTPLAGSLNLRYIKFIQTTPATNIFNETGASSCNITFQSCIFVVDSGTLLNIPTSTGLINIVECAEGASTTNNIINNAAGHCTLGIIDSSLGAGANPALISGGTRISNSRISVPITLSGAAIVIIAGSTKIYSGITLTDTAALQIFDSSIISGALAALDIGATATAILANTVINSAAANAIIGLGSCTFGEVTYLGTSTNTVTTKVYTTKVETGVLQLNNATSGALYTNAGLVTQGTLTNGQLLIGNTGNPPSIASITAAAGSGITVTAGAGTIALASNAPMTRADIAADGALAVNTSYTNTKAGLLTVTLPDGAVRDEIILIGNGAGGWIIDQTDAAHQIFVGNTNTTLGAAGSLASTNAGDCVSLRCLSAKTWRVFSMVGNLTVV